MPAWHSSNQQFLSHNGVLVDYSERRTIGVIDCAIATVHGGIGTADWIGRVNQIVFILNPFLFSRFDRQAKAVRLDSHETREMA